MKEEVVKLIITRIYCRTADAEKLADEILYLFPVSDQRELLCDFFKFFRDNGESNIGMTIDQFVDGYISHNAQAKHRQTRIK